ncbi:MAG: transcriptional regulator [Desulfobacula sp.]|nr:transcriptional regulator [Desulfobacula sp.]
MSILKIHTIELLDIIYNYLSTLDEMYLSFFIEAWPVQPFKTRIITPKNLDVISYLPNLTIDTNAKTLPILKKFKMMAKHCRWGQTYTKEDFSSTFMEKYGWTELIGMRGPVKSRELACGLLMLGPDIEYPLHSHEAQEIYIPLSSHGLWKKGDDPWEYRQEGIPIYHKSWMGHGMRTKSAPMLALYLWRGGNLTQKSHIS